MKKSILIMGMLAVIQVNYAQLANNGLSQVISIGSVTFTQLGQLCSASGNPGRLLGNRELPMSNFNLYFTGQNTHTNNAIGLGYPACSVLPAKFSTWQRIPTGIAFSSIAGSFINSNFFAGATGSMVGVSGISDGVQPTFPVSAITNIGGSFVAKNAPVNTGVLSQAIGAPGSTDNTAGMFLSQTANPGANTGVQARVGGANVNYGVSASAIGGTSSYAIWANNPGAAPNHWAGYFMGDVNITGSAPPSSNPSIPPGGPYALTVNGNALTTAGAWYLSDKRFKENIKPMTGVVEKLKDLHGYNYTYKTEEFKDRNFNAGTQMGFIAQELKAVFPQLVREGTDGFLSVNYQGMIPVLLEAIKEQQQQIDELKALVKGSGSSDTQLKTLGTIELNDNQVIVLEQNMPNPFAEQTTIGYNLTGGVQKAQILFYNADGKLINSSEIKAVAGKGQLNVFASDLSNGIYMYSLVVDGKIVETKRMIKTK